MSGAHQTLKDFWRRSGDVPVPASDAEAAVQALEQRYGLTLPEDFRAYLLRAAAYHWDRSGMIWWEPDRIKNIPDEYQQPIDHDEIAAKAASCLFFADYMIWFWAWAICCEDGPDRGKIALIGAPDRWVADSFTELVDRYVADPEGIASGEDEGTPRGSLSKIQAAAFRAFASFFRIMSRFRRDR